MQSTKSLNKKSLFLNLFLFYILYFAFSFTERKLIRKGFIGFKLPFKLDIMEALAGFILGSILIIGLSFILRNRGWILKVLLSTILIVGSIGHNIFLLSFYYPPFSITESGDLDEIGEKRWFNDHAYEMFSSLHDKYYLHTIISNPGITNRDELYRAVGFGLYWQYSKEVPTNIDQNTYLKVENRLGDSFVSIKTEDYEYRLYDAGNTDRLVLTTYQDIILFLPEDIFTE